LRQRAREAFEQKVRRGFALWEVPVGFIRTEEGRIEKTPDRPSSSRGFEHRLQFRHQRGHPHIGAALKLGGTSVMVGGIAAPLFYVSPTQINVQMPGNGSVVVSTAAGSSAPYDPDTATPNARYAGGIFTHRR
jgi:hypothetical protein